MDLPKIQDSWTFQNFGYLFEIKRIAFRNFRKFHLEDHLYQVSVKLLNNEKNPRLIDVLADMRSGLEQMVENLQDIYRSTDKEAHLYLFFDDEDSLSFVGVSTGNYTLFPANSQKDDHLHAKRIVNNALGLFRSVLQSHQKIDLTEGFVIKATILSKNNIRRKRRMGTLKEPVMID